jgi:conjugative relaxase-like TrwC/TraI family protein
MKVEGRCYGKLCEAIGLKAGMKISDEAFERVASNHHADTGEQLTERMAAARRAGYDATFNAPKSVSIQAFIGGDERLVTAHEAAVAEALGELETFAAHQVGRGLNKRYAASGQIAAAVFRHGESRALDPHLHSHAFIFNVTQDCAGPRLLALESSAIFERTRYFTEVYRNALAREVQRLGYAIERREHGFELAEISSDLLERFSKRAKERDIAIKTREAEIGRELTRDEIAIAVRENRAKKHYELTAEEVRQRQIAQVSEAELRQLHALRENLNSVSAERTALATAVGRAAEHVFERKTVVSLHELTAEVVRQSYGQHPLEAIKHAIDAKSSGLLHAEGNVTTRAALELERALIAKLNARDSTPTVLGCLNPSEAERLSPEQCAAVKTLLASTDRAVVLRGKAGTGKTHVLATAIESMTRIDGVACFAPSTQAVEILRRDGAEQMTAGRPAAGAALQQTQTVQRLLVDPKLQKSLRFKTLVIDEYGLLSIGQLKAVVDLAAQQHARLVLVGDSGQHKSVEAGDAARIVERESRITVAELREVRRQSANPAYRAAAEALAAGKIGEGLAKLDKMGAVVEIENPTARRVRMVEEWFAATQERKSVRTKSGPVEHTKTALMVAPTWAEIDALTTHAREKLRAAGKLTGTDHTFTSLHTKDWTKAQQKDARLYLPGDVLVAHKTAKNFVKGDELRVIRKEKRRLVVTRGGVEEISVSPRQSGAAWTVCEERPMAIAAGDKVRVRSVTTIDAPDGKTRRLANGTMVIVQSIAPDGHLVLADGSRLHTRQIVHGYALTSHAAQGLTVDKVFLAGAVSREGLYVSATRGREAVRVFVPNREAFLETTAFKSESRVSALEFVRQHALGVDLPSVLARGWRHLQHVRACFVEHAKRHSTPTVETAEAHAQRNAVARKQAELIAASLESVTTSRGMDVSRPSQGMRMRF